jgi:hypothetical protein
VQTADTGPTARLHHAVAFDSKRRRIVLFGGLSGRNALGDTWIWNGSEWTQEQDSGPSGRLSHALAYDTERHRIVLFGGQALINYPDLNALNDTWEYDGMRWVGVADTGPSPRGGHGMIYDGAKVLLFGGGAFADTWEWDGTRWRQLQNMGPPGRGFFGMAYDSARQHTTLYGGIGGDPFLADTWEWYDHSAAT